jgi:phosphoribosylamine--glycine ligase
VVSGGREHALCWAIAGSPLCDKLYCAPGNAGIAQEAERVPIGAEDIPGLVEFARNEKIDFVVVGPEAPLVAGLADRLEEAGIKTFGPSAAAARLEGSKGFVKDLCARLDIPTARYKRFTDRSGGAAAARAYVKAEGAPIVIKADGLAAGKGVVVATTLEEALAAIDERMTARKFGDAGASVVIEEFLTGEEASLLALVDGEHVLPLASAQDHKRVGDGDTGPNTGGMGAYSPAPVVTPEVQRIALERIFRPTVAAMKAAGTPFQGVLYAGVIIDRGQPKLIEFNVRFGDPECQALIVRLKSDLLPALVATRDGELKDFGLRWHDEASLCVVMAAKGYPGDYAKNTEIKGLDRAAKVENAVVFHAGTAEKDGKILATGGRVLGVTARGKSVEEARARAYRAVDLIDWPQGFCRRDIAWRAMKQKEQANAGSD